MRTSRYSIFMPISVRSNCLSQVWLWSGILLWFKSVLLAPLKPSKVKKLLTSLFPSVGFYLHGSVVWSHFFVSLLVMYSRYLRYSVNIYYHSSEAERFRCRCWLILLLEEILFRPWMTTFSWCSLWGGASCCFPILHSYPGAQTIRDWCLILPRRPTHT